MQLYAHIVGGAVREIVTPIDGFTLAQCFDADFASACVACDATVQPGWAYTAPATFTAPPAPPPPSLVDQANAALAVGCQIVSTGTPALSGTYPCDMTAQQRLAGNAIFVQINGKFPGSDPSQIAWIDMAGDAHVFTSTATFLTFASAIASYVAQLDEVIFGQVQTLPAQPVTIA
ncbi:MAG TPA: hypothetical protein VM689_13315 [Aliidongia sp.]|nr:hypothetical protein [Aliidongia sp.]